MHPLAQLARLLHATEAVIVQIQGQYNARIPFTRFYS